MTSAPPAPGSAEERLDAGLGRNLSVVFRAYLKATHDAMSDVAGGPRGFQVLSAAAGDRPGTQLALARLLGIDRTVMTYLLDDLEAAGLVRREPDPNDRRARRVVATPAGHARLGELHRRHQQVEDHLLAGLPAADQDAFLATLQRIALRLDAGDPLDNACAVAEEVSKGSC